MGEIIGFSERSESWLITPKEFAQKYDGRPITSVLDEWDACIRKSENPPFYFPDLVALYDLAYRHLQGWVINGKLRDQMWDKIDGRVIPTRPESHEAQRVFGDQLRRHALVIPVVCRMPGGRDQLKALRERGEDPNLWQLWGAWDSGFISPEDLCFPQEELFKRYKQARITADRVNIGAKSIGEQLRGEELVIMAKLALAARTPEEQLHLWPNWLEIHDGFLSKRSDNLNLKNYLLQYT